MPGDEAKRAEVILTGCAILCFIVDTVRSSVIEAWRERKIVLIRMTTAALSRPVRHGLVAQQGRELNAGRLRRDAEDLLSGRRPLRRPRMGCACAGGAAMMLSETLKRNEQALGNLVMQLHLIPTDFPEQRTGIAYHDIVFITSGPSLIIGDRTSKCVQCVELNSLLV